MQHFDRFSDVRVKAKIAAKILARISQSRLKQIYRSNIEGVYCIFSFWELMRLQLH